MRKNRNFNPFNCPVTHCSNLIGGQWKPVILHLVRKNCNRFSLLQKAMPGISKQMLTQQLRELEADGIIERKIFPEVPPHVEYYFTDFGRTLWPVLDAMSVWGRKYGAALQTCAADAPIIRD